MDVPVIVSATRKAILEALVDTGGELDGVVCRLFANDASLTPNTVWADLTVATFTGYAASAALVWGDPWVDVLGVWHVTAGSVQFTATDGVVPNVIYGYALTTSGGSPVLKTAFKLAVPVSITMAGDAVIVLADFPFPSSP